MRVFTCQTVPCLSDCRYPIIIDKGAVYLWKKKFQKALKSSYGIWSHLLRYLLSHWLFYAAFCPNRTATTDPNLQVSTSQTDSTSTDFDSVKERVDRANNTTGKEVKSLYMGEGKSSMQKQLETRLFFNTVKNILICVLLAVVIIALLKKGFSLKKIKKILDEDDELTDSTQPAKTPEKAETKDEPTKDDADDTVASEESDNSDEEEPPIVEPKEPDEQEVAEKCKL